MRCDWFFAYTQLGADYVVNQGFPRERTTIVQNSIDSERLADLVASVTETELDEFTHDEDLRGETALFIGGLDASKRLDFLIAAARTAHQMSGDFRLLVVGDGVQRREIEAVASAHSFIRYLGPLREKPKAIAMAAADVLTMPGRVGLIAVDSFAARTPLLTTRWQWHAPEFDYLQNGVNALVTSDDVDVFAQTLVETLRNKRLLIRLQNGCSDSARDFTLKRMVQNFLAGVEGALATA
jgi:glycosyltransferase involved in cell wall biosynthesis